MCESTKTQDLERTEIGEGKEMARKQCPTIYNVARLYSYDDLRQAGNRRRANKTMD